MAYIGIPPFGQTIRSITSTTATSGQTTFNITGGYVVGYVDVFLNGILLTPSDYTATDGLSVVLASGAATGDEFQALAYQPVSLVDTYRKSEVDSAISAAVAGVDLSSKVSKTGDTMTGNLTISKDTPRIPMIHTDGFEAHVVTGGGGDLFLAADNAASKSNTGEVYIFTGGVERMRVSASEALSSVNLEVDNAAGTGVLRATGANTVTGYIFGSNSGGAVGIGSETNHSVGLYANGQEKARIATDGAQSSVIPGGSTLYPEYKCRAWVNFNGTGTVAIRASGNVSSITDHGTGDYGVNFTTSMPDGNYSVTALTCTEGGESDTREIALNLNRAFNSTTCGILTAYASGTRQDRTQVHVAIFR